MAQLPLAAPSRSGTVMWRQVPDAELDSVMMDPSTPSAYKAQAAAEKSRRQSTPGGFMSTQGRMLGRAMGATEDGEPSDRQSTLDAYVMPVARGARAIGSAMYDKAAEGLGKLGSAYSDLGGSRRQFAPPPMGDSGFDPASMTQPLLIERDEPPIPSMQPMGMPGAQGPTEQDLTPPPQGLAQSALAPKQPTPADDIKAGADTAMSIAAPKPPAMQTAMGGDDLSGMSPAYLALAQKMIAAQDDDTGPTNQDKWLALAQGGARMLASQSPNFGGALGEGAASGVESLMKARAQRAEQAARRASQGLQVAGTAAQLQQGDRSYGLQQRQAALAERKQTGDEAEAADKKPLIEAQIANYRANAALDLARAANAGVVKSGLGSKMAIAQKLVDEAEAAGRPITFDEAIQRTFKDSPEITKKSAIDLAVKARELADVSGKSVTEEIDGILADADRISGGPKPSAGGPAAPAPAGAPSGAPKIGDIKEGFRYNGGDPAKPGSWTKV